MEHIFIMNHILSQLSISDIVRLQPYFPAIEKALAEGRPVIVCHQGQPVEIKVTCVCWPKLFPEQPDVTVRFIAGTDAMSVRFHVVGRDLRAQFAEDHGQVWTDSCCEMFCRPLGTADYHNFEINAIGAMTASVRTERKLNVRKYSSEQLAKILRFAPLGRQPLAERTGLQEWEVGFDVPYELLGECRPVVLEANFYKCADHAPHPHYLAWSPIHTEKPDFHRPECFGLCVLCD